MLALQAALESLQKAEQQVETTARRLAEIPSDVNSSGDTISLSDEMVSLMTARNTAGIAVATIRTEAEIEEHTIDVLG